MHSAGVSFILYLIAFVAFAVSTFTAVARINLVALGLAFVALVGVINGWPGG